MNKTTLTLMLLLLAGSLPAAERDTAESGAVGQKTRDALELQRSGRAASATERPLSGEVAERTYRRYADSFSHPIPESFQEEEQEFVKGSQ